MCFTFYKAKGYGIGKSLCEDELLYEAKTALQNPKTYLPKDVLVAKEAKAGSATQTVDATAIPDDHMGVDIGAKSVVNIIDFIKDKILKVFFLTKNINIHFVNHFGFIYSY